MNRTLTHIIVALLFGWATLLLFGCHPEPKPNGESPNNGEKNEGKGENSDTIPDTIKISTQAFFMPLLRFCPLPEKSTQLGRCY